MTTATTPRRVPASTSPKPRKPRLANAEARFTPEEERLIAFVAMTEHLRDEVRALLELPSLPVERKYAKRLREDLAAFCWQLDAFASAWEYAQSFEVNQEIAIRNGCPVALMVRLQKEGQPVPDDVRESAMAELKSAFGK